MISKIAAAAVCEKAGVKKTVKCIQGVINTVFLIKSQLIYGWVVSWNEPCYDVIQHYHPITSLNGW
jgi:hypothetical protein